MQVDLYIICYLRITSRRVSRENTEHENFLTEDQRLEIAMAFDEILANRVRKTLQGQPRVEEKKMMGGLTFMVDGKMCIGILNDNIMARIDPALYENALTRKGCHEMDFTGKPMKGFVFVSPDGTKQKADFDYWIGLALEFNKKAKSSEKRKK